MGNKEENTIYNPTLSRGRGVYDDNLDAVLEALWAVANENSEVSRGKIEKFLIKHARYFEDLEKRECLMRCFEGQRKLLKFKLLEKQVPAKKTGHVPGVRLEAPSQPSPQTLARARAFQAEQGAREIPPPPPLALFFLDMPNLMGYVNNSRDPLSRFRFLNIDSICWHAFFEIVTEVTGIPKEDSLGFAYLRVPTAEKNSIQVKFRNAVCNMRRVGLQVEERLIKDIDILMITDMMDPKILDFQKNRVVKIVVGTSDGDFAYPIKRLKRIAQDVGTNLSICTLSWTDSRLSRDLVEAADKVYPVEDFLYRLDPQGHSLRESVKETTGRLSA